MNIPDLSGYNDHQLVAWVLVVWITTIGGVALLYLKTRKADNNAKEAAENAAVAARQTAATGNGFAGKVKNDLAEIKQMLAEFREESRVNDARIESRLDGHMNNHDRRNNA